MSRITIHLSVTILIFFTMWCPGLAETYTCSEGVVKNEAKVGVHRGSAVTITEDETDRECAFSVNGAKVGSPPQDKILSGFNSIISGSVVRELQERNIASLAYALLASAPVAEIPKRMDSELYRYRKELSECLAGFIYGKEPRTLKSNAVLCRAWSPKDQGPHTISLPTLEIAVRWDGTTSRLFLPKNYRRGIQFDF